MSSPESRRPTELAPASQPETSRVQAKDLLKDKEKREAWFRKSGALELQQRINAARLPVTDAILETDDLAHQAGVRSKEPIKPLEQIIDPLERQAHQDYAKIMERLFAEDQRLDLAQFELQRAFDPLAKPKADNIFNRRKLAKDFAQISKKYQLEHQKSAADAPELGRFKEYATKKAKLERIMGEEIPDIMRQVPQLFAGLDSDKLRFRCQGYFQELLQLWNQDQQLASRGAVQERFDQLTRVEELIDKLKHFGQEAIREEIKEIGLKARAREEIRSLRHWAEQMLDLKERFKGVPLSAETTQSLTSQFEAVGSEMKKWVELLEKQPIVLESGALAKLHERARGVYKAFIDAYAIKERPAALTGREQQKALPEWREGSEAARFTVSDALNPYREAWLEGGITDPQATAERQDRELDLLSLLEEDRAAYAASDLPDWAASLEAIRGDLRLTPEKRQIIEQELKDGAIAILMPGRATQQATTSEQYQKNLKPIWIKDNAPQTIDDAYLWEHMASLIKNKNPQLTEDLPERPYLLLFKPTPAPEARTTNKTVKQQLAELKKINQERSKNGQSSAHIIKPVEYAAAQKRFTESARNQSSQPLINLRPLDSATWSRFIDLPLSAGGYVSGGSFDPGLRRLGFVLAHAASPYPQGGFRLSVRVEL